MTSLDALTSVHHVHGLSVKQLKLILQQNCINYKGCVEKEECQARVHRLWQAKEDERIKVAPIVQAGDLGKGWARKMIGLGEDKGGRFMQVEILGKGWIWITGFQSNLQWKF